MNKIKNTNKGITLIALVITIVVMLILVAVTITMAVNGGLFDYAGKAVEETKNAIALEQELAGGRIKIGEVWYDSIDDYIKNKPSSNQGEEEEPEEPATPSITLSATTIEEQLAYNATKTAELEATLENVTGDLTWTSSDPTIAEVVTGTGNKRTINLKKLGTATITVSNGTTSATCAVTLTVDTIEFILATDDFEGSSMTLYAQRGMKWEDWVLDLSYNTINCRKEGGGVFSSDGVPVYITTGAYNAVTLTDTILEGAVYTFAAHEVAPE